MAKGDRYSKMDELTALGFLSNALFDKGSPDGDKGASFPRSDAEDLSRGARFIPGEVTLARRRGEKVQFNTDCQNTCCWYWKLPDGTRIYHFDRAEYDELKKKHKGRCPNCGNIHIGGGVVKEK